MTGPSQKVIEHAQELGDIGAGAITIAAIMQWAPPISAVATAAYLIFRLYVAVDKHIYERKQREKN